MANLSTSPGDGSLQVGVDAFGSFGSAAQGDGTSNAVYNPIGEINSSGTSFESALAIRVGSGGERTFLTTGNIFGGELENPGFNSQTSNATESKFAFEGLDFDLTQTAQDSFSEGERIGSLLTQTYEITNTGDEEIAFELVRYLDGDLQFNGSIEDGGGRIFRDGEEILFETDTAGESAESNTFIGITGVGGDAAAPGRYEIDSFSGLGTRIAAGTELDDIITNDNDGDGFVDAGSGYDITLGLNNEFALAPGASTTYTTKTIFGSGSTEDVNSEDPEIIQQSLNPIRGTSGDDVLIGTDADDDISAGSGNDVLEGGPGNDILRGRGGRDVLAGGAGNDELDGGAGVDTVVYETNTEGVSASLADGTANAGASNIDVFSGIENLVGSDVDDSLTGDDGANSLTGRGGDDAIVGGAGNDFIIGGNGADSTTGGAGNDLFIFSSPGEGGDTITDFEVGVDKISPVSAVFGLPSGPLPGSRFGLGTAATDGDQRFVYDDGTGDLFFDADGNGSQGQQLIANVGAGTGLSSSDIQLL